MKYFIGLLVLCMVTLGSGRPQDDVAEARQDIRFNRDDANATGPERTVKQDEIINNFRNPILEYLLKGEARLGTSPPVTRQVQHSQSLLLPLASPQDVSKLLQPLSLSTESKKRDPNKSPLENFFNFVNTEKTNEVVTSPVLHLTWNRTGSEADLTRVQTYPAVAVVLNTFGKDGALKNSVVHFQPDFKSSKWSTSGKNAIEVVIKNRTLSAEEKYDTTHKLEYSEHHNHSSGALHSKLIIENEEKKKTRLGEELYEEGQPPPPAPRQSLPVSWPFAQYFPIVVRDPFLSAYNAFSSAMYNTFTSMIEYGPEADICRIKSHHHSEQTIRKDPEDEHHTVEPTDLPETTTDISVTESSNSYDEETMTQNYITPMSDKRMKRQVKITVKEIGGGHAEVAMNEPERSGEWLGDEVEERARSHAAAVINPPPLSSILRPPYKGGFSTVEKVKANKPGKEENEETSEEVGEEQETSSSSESSSDGVAISPPPEGASVAEAKPVGLAIAGPGGVAAAKPQATAVAGPGGLAIARPVGTAIAGVEVEGSIPIGQQQKKDKNKKKQIKQDSDSMESELQYVGGLTGPIGNPQPKQFIEENYFGGLRGANGKPLPVGESLFRGGNEGGYGLRLGSHGGRYGFLPMRVAPNDRLQKRMDSSTFFHGMLGANEEMMGHNMAAHPVIMG